MSLNRVRVIQNATMETPDVDFSSFLSNFECTIDESSKRSADDVIEGHTVKKTKIDESSLLQKIKKLRESKRIMKTEIRNAKAEIQELREQMTLLNGKVDLLSKKRTYKKNNVMDQLDVIKDILIDMKK